MDEWFDDIFLGQKAVRDWLLISDNGVSIVRISHTAEISGHYEQLSNGMHHQKFYILKNQLMNYVTQ